MSPIRDIKSRRSSLARSAKQREKEARDTLVRKPSRSKEDSQRAAQIEEVSKMKNCLVRLEVVLNEMREMVQKKEKSISSKSSIYSAKTEMSKDRDSKEARKRSLKHVNRRNLFFGNQRDRSDKIEQRNTAPAAPLSGKADPGRSPLQKPPQNFKQYIRDCFLNKIKGQQIDLQVLSLKPKLPKPAVAERLQAAVPPKKQAPEDTIEFLTPSQSSQVKHGRMSYLAPETDSERADSLVYTVSKSQKRQMVSSFRPLRGVAGHQEISGFD